MSEITDRIAQETAYDLDERWEKAIARAADGGLTEDEAVTLAKKYGPHLGPGALIGAAVAKRVVEDVLAAGDQDGLELPEQR